MKRNEINIESIMDQDNTELEYISLDSFKDFVDEIEIKTNEIKSLLDITHIGELENIETAFDRIKDLSDELY